MAGYHQFHAVNVAIQETLRAARMREETQEVREHGDGYRTRNSRAVSQVIVGLELSGTRKDRVRA